MFTPYTAKEVVISIGNQQITGKDVVCTDMAINQGIDRSLEIEMRLVCTNENFIMEMWDENYKPKIHNKKVEDCSIQELLFAIRKKIGEHK